MTDKTPIDTILEDFSFSSLTRDVLGESLLENAPLTDLKRELFYYQHQAAHGPTKSRRVMADKAARLSAQIAKLEKVDEDMVKKVPLQVSEKTVNDETVLNNFLKNVKN
jgi:hypothetical protein